VADARRFLASHKIESYVVNSYNLRPRKFRFVDKSTRSPYKMSNPISTKELARADQRRSSRNENPDSKSLKRKRLEFN